MAPFRQLRITPDQLEFNAAMTTCRIQVENAFGATATLWRSNQFASMLQMGNSPVAKLYMVSILLMNIHRCVNQTPSPFGILPPTVEEYLG
jgi:hypothetical protein